MNPPASGDRLQQPVDQLRGIGPHRARLLANLGIRTVEDLLFHTPRAYQDRRHFQTIATLKPGETVSILGRVVRAQNRRLRGRGSIAVIVITDETGEVEATFFGRGFLANALAAGTRIILYGKMEGGRRLTLKNPDYEVLTGDADDALSTGRIVPVYALTEKITQRMLRGWIANAIHECGALLPDRLPHRLRTKYEFPPAAQALAAAHYPESPGQADQARRRFAYEELLAMQLALLQARNSRAATAAGIIHPLNGPLLRGVASSLPFQLTSGQAQAVTEILRDMGSARPMHRLLQGDVGCGKTIVAVHAMAAALDGGHQVALMAPTEVLADQHYRTLHRILAPHGIEAHLLTGSIRSAAALRRRIAEGAVQLVIGTQALIQESTRFARLGLVIVDEQHRFGVGQRLQLQQKGEMPDALHMTATPIPRTLAMTLYGAMDVTVIEDMPPGRQPVKTVRIPAHKLPGMYDYLRSQAALGRQTYYICPLIEASEARELAAVLTHFEELSSGPLAGLRTELLHGRLDAREKDLVVDRFQAGEIDVIFSTTVVEVGIDVPNATTIVVEDAAQFGLTQLHQLRGRVGRGTLPAFCFLLGTPATDDGRDRLDVLCQTQNGFEIAEADLRLRGPGEIYGLRQAGLTDLRVADLIRDGDLLRLARKDAGDILEHDGLLTDPDHAGLKSLVTRFGNLTG